MSWFLISAVVYLLVIVVMCRFFSLNKKKCYVMPVENGRPQSKIGRAKQLAISAAHDREQLDAKFHELCGLFGTHPDEDTFERDWVVNIVYYGTPLQSFLDHRANLQREESEAETRRSVL